MELDRSERHRCFSPFGVHLPESHRRTSALWRSSRPCVVGWPRSTLCGARIRSPRRRPRTTPGTEALPEVQRRMSVRLRRELLGTRQAHNGDGQEGGQRCDGSGGPSFRETCDSCPKETARFHERLRKSPRPLRRRLVRPIRSGENRQKVHVRSNGISVAISWGNARRKRLRGPSASSPSD